jgi:nicotinate-nucleotide pyrophosphorylase (carboxylating)
MPSELYYRIASEAFCSTNLPKTGFSVQAMMIFAIAQHHSNLKLEARRTLDMAISIGLELRINSKEFAYEHGEGDPVLEESWRRTYYFLYMADQHFAISATNPLFTMIHVENEVDLPCDDEFYETGVSTSGVREAEAR